MSTQNATAPAVERREIKDHHDGHGLAESLRILADGPGPGGASHYYVVGSTKNRSLDEFFAKTETQSLCALEDPLALISYQKGPRDEIDSQPGVLDSVLLAIVADRMRSFQAGPFGCRENALVLTKVEEALHWLKHRADERARRGVLGRNAK